MIALHLLRHADAGDPDAWKGPDELRPLSPKGRRQADRLGRHLAAIDYRLDLIVSSPKLRAMETAERVAEPLGLPVLGDARLGEPLGPGEVTALLADHGDARRPLLVGHDPGFSALLSLLAGASLSMKKGALARLDLDVPLEPGTAELAFLLPPALLPD